MRPRHYAADNDDTESMVTINEQASMRPRHYAADNISFCPTLRVSTRLQ